MTNSYSLLSAVSLRVSVVFYRLWLFAHWITITTSVSHSVSYWQILKHCGQRIFLNQNIPNNKISDICLHVWALLYVSLKQNLIKLTSFLGIQDSKTMLYKTSLLTEMFAFLKCTNRGCATALYSRLFSHIWCMQNICPEVNLARPNPKFIFPV
jgi:hypothetical protein